MHSSCCYCLVKLYQYPPSPTPHPSLSLIFSMPCYSSSVVKHFIYYSLILVSTVINLRQIKSQILMCFPFVLFRYIFFSVWLLNSSTFMVLLVIFCLSFFRLYSFAYAFTFCYTLMYVGDIILIFYFTVSTFDYIRWVSYPHSFSSELLLLSTGFIWLFQIARINNHLWRSDIYVLWKCRMILNLRYYHSNSNKYYCIIVW